MTVDFAALFTRVHIEVDLALAHYLTSIGPLPDEDPPVSPDDTHDDTVEQIPGLADDLAVFLFDHLDGLGLHPVMSRRGERTRGSAPRSSWRPTAPARGPPNPSTSG